MDDMRDMSEKPQDGPESKKTNDVVFLDLFNPTKPRSDKELIEHRLNICNGCAKLDKRLMKCKMCGCFMQLKSTLLQASCPLGKW